jgi:hypothetical protein
MLYLEDYDDPMSYCDEALWEASRAGDLDYVKLFVEKGVEAGDLEEGFYAAMSRNHQHVMDYYKSLGVTPDNKRMFLAAMYRQDAPLMKKIVSEFEADGNEGKILGLDDLRIYLSMTYKGDLECLKFVLDQCNLKVYTAHPELVNDSLFFSLYKFGKNALEIGRAHLAKFGIFI